MKRLFFVVLFAVAGMLDVMGQLPDTIYCRSRNYFYNRWYDSCCYFNSPPNTPGMIDRFEFDGDWPGRYSGRYFGTSFHTDYPMDIQGLSCMVNLHRTQTTGCHYVLTGVSYPQKLPEYMHVCVYDSVQEVFISIDSLRWDTASPKILKLPLHFDSSDGFCQLHVYEAMFPKPVTVDGDFWIFGTLTDSIHQNVLGVYDYTPTVYAFFEIYREYWPYYPESHGMYYQFCRSHCPGMWGQQHLRSTTLNVSNSNCYNHYYFGPFHPIINSKLVEVYPSDTLLGSAGPVGYVADSSYCNIYARPVHAARFVGWSDGGAGVDRVLHVTSDTVLTAYFEAKDTFYVTAVTPNGHLGTVTGGGMYFEGDTAILEASPIRGYRFEQWNDGVRDNPRRVPLTSDTAFTAYFEALDSMWVEVWVNDEGWGVVQGGGLHYEGEEVKLKAFGKHGHSFSHWGDGSTSNMKTFMACDTTLEAYFSEYSAIDEAKPAVAMFELVPNPATGRVTVVTGEGVECDGRCRMAVHDAEGREVCRMVLESKAMAIDIAGWRAGVYYVTLITPQGLSTRKLVVE